MFGCCSELRAKDIARVQSCLDDLDNKEKRQKLTKDQKEEQESCHRILDFLNDGKDARSVLLTFTRVTVRDRHQKDIDWRL